MEIKGEAMSISKKITRFSLHAIALLVTVTLVTGLAAFGNDVYASSSPSPFRNTKSTYQHNSRFDGHLIVHGVLHISSPQQVTGTQPKRISVTMQYSESLIRHMEAAA